MLNIARCHSLYTHSKRSLEYDEMIRDNTMNTITKVHRCFIAAHYDSFGFSTIVKVTPSTLFFVVTLRWSCALFAIVLMKLCYFSLSYSVTLLYKTDTNTLFIAPTGRNLMPSFRANVITFMERLKIFKKVKIKKTKLQMIQCFEKHKTQFSTAKPVMNQRLFYVEGFLIS